VSSIEALRAALEAGPTPGPWKALQDAVWRGSRRVCPHVTAGESLPLSEDHKRAYANAAYIAAACNAAPELLAEVDKAQRSADHWHDCFTVLEKAIVGDTAASAIHEAKRLRAEVDRLTAERDALRAAIQQALPFTLLIGQETLQRALKERT
jgi:hypothetical protein